LEDDDLPEGDWVCIKCFSSKPDVANRVTAAAATRVTANTDALADKKKTQAS
jgi:hypothetical protein